MSRLRVLFCASEMAPFAKTGGLADVVAALPLELKKRDIDVACAIPCYGKATEAAAAARPTGKGLSVRLGAAHEEFAILERRAGGVPVYLLASKSLFDRPGLYGEAGKDYGDNVRRFAFFSMACLELASHIGFDPDVYHVHDWQTALIPVYLARSSVRRARSLLTIHNLAYQGIAAAEELHRIGLDGAYFHWQLLEYYGKINLLKGGIVFADAISTVSPTYALEIQGPELGCGLEGVLAERSDKLQGILNGIDSARWNPETDELLPATYSLRNPSGKALCREALFAEAKLKATPKPLIGLVTRLTEQKGLDILIPAMRALLGEGYPFAVLGQGMPVYERTLQELKRSFPGRLGLFLAFDDRLAHRVEAGSDLFLMPSRFEPCGLNQFYSMRYGTVPVVRATGGLADSVVPFTPQGVREGLSTGFLFRPYDSSALLETVRQAASVFADKKVWSQLIRNGMAQDFGWGRSADRYVELYRRLVEA